MCYGEYGREDDHEGPRHQDGYKQLRRDIPEVNCGTCRFFLANQKFGMCQRYPEYVMKQDTQWCGEFQKKQEAIIEEPKKRRKNDPAIARPDSSQAD